MNQKIAFVAILSAILLPSFTWAVTIAEHTFDSDIGLNSFTLDPIPGTFSSPDDAFQVFHTGETWPRQLADESNVDGETDNLGIIDVSSKTDAWFGITDTINGDNPSGTGTAVWVFDISGATQLSASIDIGAMGSFEDTQADDHFDWSYSIDQGISEPLFVSSVDLEGSHLYTLADGQTTREMPSPLLINEVLVHNTLQTISAPISGSGALLTITLMASTDGGTEGVAFDNLVISGTIESGGGDLPGDYNDSGLVEQGDLDLVLLNWGGDWPPVISEWINQQPTDGNIDQNDLDGVLLNWGNSAAGAGAVAATVPEPTGFAIFLVATVIGSLGRGRSQRTAGERFIPAKN